MRLAPDLVRAFVITSAQAGLTCSGMGCILPCIMLRSVAVTLPGLLASCAHHRISSCRPFIHSSRQTVVKSNLNDSIFLFLLCAIFSKDIAINKSREAAENQQTQYTSSTQPQLKLQQGVLQKLALMSCAFSRTAQKRTAMNASCNDSI